MCWCVIIIISNKSVHLIAHKQQNIIVSNALGVISAGEEMSLVSAYVCTCLLV